MPLSLVNMSKHFLFPKPKDWNTFEDIVADVFSRRYHNQNFQRYGRSGQRQHGVDIVGPVNTIGLLGIQCKHRTREDGGNLSATEIDAEIAESEKFHPTLGEYVIVTSADRATSLTQHVLSISEARKNEGKYPVTIKFWEDIVSWLTDYPDLVYRHFTKHFPLDELEHISLPANVPNKKQAILWPSTATKLQERISQCLGGVEKTDPYRVTLGLTSFEDVSFTNLADVEIQLSRLFASEQSSQDNFREAAQVLSDFRAAISGSYFSRELFVYLQARLTLAFLFGWIFRSVTHFDLILLARDGAWSTSGLPHVPSRLTDALPIMSSSGNEEIVLILNINRDITSSVVEFVGTWSEQPMAVLSVNLETREVESAAHALSIAREVARKIKTINDKWHAQHIHLFGSMPAPLATLIAFGLNAVCPISIYYMNRSHRQYQQGGTIVNDL